MNVLVTGSNGFIGKNLRLFLESENNITVLTYDRSNTLDELEFLIKKSDFIIHLAGVNRPQTADEFFSGNTDLTKNIVDILRANDLCIPLVFSSSIQASLDNDYGKSKRLAEDYIINNYKHGIIYRLHNVFGKDCRPNYNSVVATFCYNIANDLPVTISDPKHELELIYIDDICKTFIQIIKKELKPKDDYNYIDPVYTITLQSLTDTLKQFKEDVHSISIPNTGDDFIKKLFSTFISYCPLETLEFIPEHHDDERGSFVELAHTLDSGQFSVSTSKPGITRGNHYHHTKIEKFIVLKGEAVISLRKIGDDKVRKVSISGDSPKIVTIPVGYTHNITNIGEEDMVLLIWCNEIFNQSNPDTYYEEV